MVKFFYGQKFLCAVSAKESSVSEILAIKELLAKEQGCNMFEIIVKFGGD